MMGRSSPKRPTTHELLGTGGCGAAISQAIDGLRRRTTSSPSTPLLPGQRHLCVPPVAPARVVLVGDATRRSPPSRANPRARWGARHRMSLRHGLPHQPHRTQHVPLGTCPKPADRLDPSVWERRRDAVLRLVRPPAFSAVCAGADATEALAGCASVLSAARSAYHAGLLRVSVLDRYAGDAAVSGAEALERVGALRLLADGLHTRDVPEDQWPVLDAGDRVAGLSPLAPKRPGHPLLPWALAPC